MPVNTNISQGVDLNILASKAAKQMLDNQAIAKREIANIESESDTLYVNESQSINGTITWTVVSGLPFDIQPYSVCVSISDVARNNQSRRELLERRLRRGFRDRLSAEKLLPESIAKARVLRMKVCTL